MGDLRSQRVFGCVADEGQRRNKSSQFREELAAGGGKRGGGDLGSHDGWK